MNIMKESLNIWPDVLATSALLTLAVYHVMIFLGRKKDNKETYNLYFACFVFSMSLVIISPHLQKNWFLGSLRPDWLYVINIEMITIGLFVFSGINFLNHIFEISLKLKKYFLLTYISITLAVLLTLTSNFISKEFYFKHVLIYLLITVSINILLINFLYGKWIFKKALYKEKFIIILYIGYLLLTFNMLIYRILEISNPNSILISNHYFTVVILYIFTYALTLKFNKEHHELKTLKLNLESRIKEHNDNEISNYQILLKKFTRPIITIPPGNKATSLDEQFLHKALQIIEQNIDETSFNSEKLSKEIGISRAHLHRKLKALTDQSTTEFIRSIRLTRAAELLNQKTATVSEIAYHTGFNNLSYFSRCFKEEFGVVPSEYFSNLKSKPLLNPTIS
jgi:AraC-like DNA-binding protein